MSLLKCLVSVVFAIGLLSCLACGGGGSGDVIRSRSAFAATASVMGSCRSQGAVLLSNGKFLMMWSGVSSITLYDPLTKHADQIPMGSCRVNFTVTALPNGKVLIAGGNDGYYYPSAELYDPLVGQLERTGAMMVPWRNAHTATLLPDGKVLLAGGSRENGENLDSAELYDPDSGTFQMVSGRMVRPRSRHSAVLLLDGMVLLTGGEVGGLSSSGRPASSVAELYDFRNNRFIAMAPMLYGRFGHTSTLLPDGKVLLAGGGSGLTSELFDPDSAVFIPTGPMLTSRMYHASTLLPSGKVLLTGGLDARSGYVVRSELYDYKSGHFEVAGFMVTPRYYHAAGLLPDGTVLLAGGLFDGGLKEEKNELYLANYPRSGASMYRVGEEFSFFVGKSIDPIIPQTGNGFYSVIPALPFGLDLNLVNGVISGTPLFATPFADYSVWFADGRTVARTKFNIAVY